MGFPAGLPIEHGLAFDKDISAVRKSLVFWLVSEPASTAISLSG